MVHLARDASSAAFGSLRAEWFWPVTACTLRRIDLRPALQCAGGVVSLTRVLL